MQYQFEEPFIVDSSKIANKLGVHATPVEQALADTLATYQQTQYRRLTGSPFPDLAATRARTESIRAACPWGCTRLSVRRPR